MVSATHRAVLSELKDLLYVLQTGNRECWLHLLFVLLGLFLSLLAKLLEAPTNLSVAEVASTSLLLLDTPTSNPAALTRLAVMPHVPLSIAHCVEQWFRFEIRQRICGF